MPRRHCKWVPGAQPDPSIVGPFNKSTDPALKAKRDEYIEQRRQAGATDKQIASELGIVPNSLSEYMIQRKNPRVLFNWHKRSKGT